MQERNVPCINLLLFVAVSFNSAARAVEKNFLMNGMLLHFEKLLIKMRIN